MSLEEERRKIVTNAVEDYMNLKETPYDRILKKEAEKLSVINKEETTLSDKRKSLRGVNLTINQFLDVIQEQDKEALKRLKEKICHCVPHDKFPLICDNCKHIDKIFGEELTK